MFARIRIYDPSEHYVELWLNVKSDDMVEAAKISTVFCAGVAVSGTLTAKVFDLTQFSGSITEIFEIDNPELITNHINRYLGAPRA